MKVKQFFRRTLSDRAYRWYVVAIISFILSIAFLTYNLILGVIFRLVWNFSVTFYYLLLMLIKAIILQSENKWKLLSETELRSKRLKLFKLENVFLLLIDFALIAPITLMILSQKNTVNIGMIPTIAVAAYTTFRVVMACINYHRSKKTDNLALHGLKIISLKEAIVSIITLQNTMVVVFGDFKQMLTLTTVTSAGMLASMIAISIMQIIKLKIEKGK